MQTQDEVGPPSQNWGTLKNLIRTEVLPPRSGTADLMDVMMDARTNPGIGGSRSNRFNRLELETALELGRAEGLPLGETVRRAAEAAGGEFLFVLPALDGRGNAAIVRLVDSGQSRFLQVRRAGSAFAVAEEAEIDRDLLLFARASIDVLERLRDDRRVLAPLSASSH